MHSESLLSGRLRIFFLYETIDDVVINKIRQIKLHAGFYIKYKMVIAHYIIFKCSVKDLL